MPQHTTLLMIRPAAFGFNEQTAGSNAFQKAGSLNNETQATALEEFDRMVATLRQHDVDVIVIDDTLEPVKPDAIFPNNWVSFHETGDVILYPMQAENRRLERREDIFRKIEDHFAVKHTVDLSRFELQNKFLEGTGSMVLDRANKIAYACISPRTDADVLQSFCDYTGYRSVSFAATDENGQAIYHTNVLMCIGNHFAVICLESIKSEAEQEHIIENLIDTGKEIIPISFNQLNHFAGNMLEVTNRQGQPLLVMSQQAKQSLTNEQIAQLSAHAEIVTVDINTIENIGGGSARCMMAEICLPALSNAKQ